MRLTSSHAPDNSAVSRVARPFLLTYKRLDWKPETAPRYKHFETEDAARESLARLQNLARFGPVVARLEVREGGRWREIEIGGAS